jgi:hypothetical protein
MQWKACYHAFIARSVFAADRVRPPDWPISGVTPNADIPSVPPPALGERGHRGLALVGSHGRIIMIGVSAKDLFRPNEFLMRLEDFTAGAGDKPDRNATGDQRIEECVAS